VASANQQSAPLPIASVVDHVYAAIRERIVTGRLPRGSRLHQEELAAELGVSRTPVREALRRLGAEGLVQMHTNRGARVADLQGEDVVAPTEARMVIEPGAARLAAARRAPSDRMRAALATQRKVIPDVDRSFKANREFHLALVEASGNPFLLQFAEILWVSRIGAPIYARQAETAARMELDADEHEQIVEAIEAGDARRAETLTRRHLADALKRLLAAMERSDGDA
jgi:DNA-binding GntR family transcriptional regulator